MVVTTGIGEDGGSHREECELIYLGHPWGLPRWDRVV